MCETNPSDVWDKPTLGPDTSGVLLFAANPKERAWSERALLLAQPFNLEPPQDVWDKPARCTGQTDTGVGYLYRFVGSSWSEGAGVVGACSHNPPPTLQCDFGARKMCETNLPDV